MKAEKTRKHIMTTDNWLGYITADPIWDELTELERLADIGRATEKAFEDSANIHMLDINGDGYCIRNVAELLDWNTCNANGETL